MALFLNIEGINNYYKRYIKQCMINLQSARDIMQSAISNVPSDFTYSSKLISILNEISEIESNVKSVDRWIDQSTSSLRNAESNNIKAINQITQNITIAEVGGSIITGYRGSSNNISSTIGNMNRNTIEDNWTVGGGLRGSKKNNTGTWTLINDETDNSNKNKKNNNKNNTGTWTLINDETDNSNKNKKNNNKNNTGTWTLINDETDNSNKNKKNNNKNNTATWTLINDEGHKGNSNKKNPKNSTVTGLNNNESGKFTSSNNRDKLSANAQNGSNGTRKTTTSTKVADFSDIDVSKIRQGNSKSINANNNNVNYTLNGQEEKRNTFGSVQESVKQNKPQNTTTSNKNTSTNTNNNKSTSANKTNTNNKTNTSKSTNYGTDPHQGKNNEPGAFPNYSSSTSSKKNNSTTQNTNKSSGFTPVGASSSNSSKTSKPFTPVGANSSNSGSKTSKPFTPVGANNKNKK